MTSMILLTVLALSSTCLAAPSASISHGLMRDYEYLHHQHFLSRAVRQAEDEKDDSFKKLLVEMKLLTAQTVKNYGCRFNPSSQQFTQTFVKAFFDVKANADPNTSTFEFTQDVAAKVVSEYGCAGTVTSKDPVFENKFKAAYSQSILEAGEGNADNRAVAAVIAANEYNCKQDPNSKDFIELWLSVFFDAVERVEMLQAEGKFDEEGNDVTRWHMAQVIKKLGCGNPNYDSEEFKSAYVVAQITIFLS